MSRSDEGRVGRWRVAPGASPDLRRRRPDDTAGAPGDRALTEEATARQIEELASWQDRLWAEGRRSVLVVLQGVDASGKDGTIKHVFRGVNPQGVRVASFKEPTALELAHDFLWRVHRLVPAAGEIGIFNRSHYEDVLVARVHDLVPEAVWRARYDLLVDFERILAHGGTTVVKLMLHVSSEEQGRRLAERRERPDKQWKLQPGDFAEHARSEAYTAAYEEALARTGTVEAPWYVVPADHKWFRNWVVGEILLHTLSQMDPRYPRAPRADVPVEP